jgi:transcriptional regulator with XRE-family HTH domain
MMLLTGPQLRGARAMARMEQERLADLAGVAVTTVRRLEAENGLLEARTVTLRKLQEALEAAGVEFIPGGARLREPADV